MAGRNRGKVELTFWKANSSAVISQFQWEKNNVLKHEILQLERRKILQKAKKQETFPEKGVQSISRDLFLELLLKKIK